MNKSSKQTGGRGTKKVKKSSAGRASVRDKSARMLPTRRLGAVVVAAAIVLFVAHLCIYGVGNLRMDIGSMFTLFYLVPLLFCGLFLMTRETRSQMFVAVMGLAIVAVYAVFPISLFFYIGGAIGNQRIDFPWKFVDYLIIVLTTVSVVLGAMLCMYVARKGGAWRAARVVSMVGAGAGGVLVLCVVAGMVLVGVWSATEERRFEELRGSPLSVVWPDDSGDELQCESEARCELEWVGGNYRVVVEREDVRRVYIEGGEYRMASSVAVSVYPRFSLAGADVQEWPLYVYYVAVADGRAVTPGHCSSFHGYHERLSSCVAFPGEDESLYDDPADCSVPFGTSVVDGRVVIEAPES